MLASTDLSKVCLLESVCQTPLSNAALALEKKSSAASTNVSLKKGRVSYKYAKCGRKPWLITPDVSKFLVGRLLSKRSKTICSSSSLRADLFKTKRVRLSDSAIRKHLASKGYHWLPRSQKRAYSVADRKARVAFAKRIARMSDHDMEEHVAFAMDGVVANVVFH